jgi:hypothetical protein
MLSLRNRLAIAGVITATAIALPAAALASASASPSGTPKSPPTLGALASKSAAAQSQSTARPSGKPTPPQSSATGTGTGKSGAPSPQLTGLPKAASALAARLGVSIDAAQRATKQIGGLIINNGGVEEGSSAFAAIAHTLGVSTAQLAAAWNAVKHDATLG